MTETIPADYGRLFGIPARDRSSTVTVHAAKASKCCGPTAWHGIDPEK